MRTDWTHGLNPEQREAVLHNDGPLLILAGAGSGKTTVLVSRTGQILTSGKARAEEVCVLTFTNKAARELKHRVTAKLGSVGRDLWTGTFHSFGLQILRKFHKQAGLPHSFGVIDQTDSHAILKELMVNVRNTAKDAFKVDKIFSMMSDWRERGQKRAKNSSDEYEVMCEVLLPKYIRQMELLGVTDFEGLLLKPLDLFKNNPDVLAYMQNSFRQVMVDEFQDTNRTQFKLIQALVMNHNNIAVVGDDDQSIYGWRGACVSNILDFPHQFDGCQVIRLERNYRSTPAIISVANEVIKKNETRHSKVLKANPDAEHGVKPEIFVYDNDDLEAEEVIRHINDFRAEDFRFRDIAILYRSNGQGGLLEGLLRQNQIPYAITGGTGFFDRKETKDLLAYLRCALAPNEVAFRRIINTPSRGLGETTVDKLQAHAQAIGISFHKAAHNWRFADIPEKTGAIIDDFLKMLARLPDEIVGGDLNKTCGEQLIQWFEGIGYKAFLRTTTKDDQTLYKKWMVLEIFGRVLDRFVERGGRNRQTLLEFVDCMELRDPGDDMNSEKDSDKVQLLTLHACKGLEFPAVIMIGMEEDLLPHRTLGQDVSEERRLFYVGLTRAKERLVLTRARQRKRFGRLAPVAPSRFLLEIPGNLITVHESGYRPVSSEQKQNLFADFFAKVETKIASQKIE